MYEHGINGVLINEVNFITFLWLLCLRTMTTVCVEVCVSFSMEKYHRPRETNVRSTARCTRVRDDRDAAKKDT